MEVYVFRKDSWHQISLPTDTECWSQAERQLYGTLVLTYMEKGIHKLKAEQLAESFVFTKHYHGLRYDASWERAMRHPLESATRHPLGTA